MSSVNIYGINIKNTSLEETIRLLKEELKKPGLFTIATPNTEICMHAKKDKGLQDLINSFDLVLADGIGLIYASKIRNHPLKERVTGYDVSIELLNLSEDMDLDFYFLGGKPGVVEDAKIQVEKNYPNARVCGTHHGYFSQEEESSIVDDINKSRPDVIFVGLGFPKQEQFIQRNKDKLDQGIIIGNGGVLDILGGRANRAPDIFIKLNLEWFYRLITNPSRLKRQLALPQFMFNILIDKNSVKKGDQADND